MAAALETEISKLKENIKNMRASIAHVSNELGATDPTTMEFIVTSSYLKDQKNQLESIAIPPNKAVLMQKSSSNSVCLCGKDCHNEGGLAKHVLTCKLHSNKRVTIQQAFTSSISESIPEPVRSHKNEGDYVVDLSEESQCKSAVVVVDWIQIHKK